MEAVLLGKLKEAVLDKLIEAGFEYLKDQVRWQTGMKEELEKLRGIQFTKIQAVFAYASNKLQINDVALNKWLRLLRDAIDETEDLLDVFDYMKLQKQELAKKKSKASFYWGEILKVGQRLLKIDPNLKRLEEVVQKFDKVSSDVDIFFHLVKEEKQEQGEQLVDLDKTYETARLLPPNSQIIGRDEHKESVLRWVSNPSNENQSLITDSFENISLKSIVGHGGMGKTTLLQHVLKDDRTREFDFKMWVYVSNKFDVKKVIADMLDSPEINRPHSPSDSLDKLAISLQSALKFKKFLLVLDDIWNDDHLRDKLEKVLSPLSSGCSGSKILVTTRMEEVAAMIACVMDKEENDTLFKLEGLNEDDCLELLNNHAFAGVKKPHNLGKLRPIAEKIVQKLSGSPLVAKVIGGDLNSSKDENYWINVLNSDIVSEAPFQDKVLKVLRRSYNILTRSEQICFAFCSIFPQNHEFDKDDLVRMWIALSFIHPTGGKTIEVIGGDYFNVLFKKSLLEKFEAKDRTYYKMHDLIRELALSVSKQESLSIVGDKMSNSDNPESIRHLSVETRDLKVLGNTKKFVNLRSLVLYYEGTVDLDAEIFKAWRSIRLLYIYAPNQKLTFESIGHLIHLRYLKLVKTSATLLPRSLSNLYLLRFIVYDKKVWSFQENFLPRDFNNLNLHHLQLPWDKLPVIHGIVNLNSLQRVDGFYIKIETNYRMEVLEHMNELSQLRIKQLENVKDVGEACSAKLLNKRKLMDLSLEWGEVKLRINEIGWGNISLNEEVLDNLQPHNKLKKLRINGYMGARSARWMSNVDSISSLEYVQLDNCLKWQTLPSFGQLRFLKALYLHNMPEVKSLGDEFQGKDCVFQSLEVLHFEKLEGLKVWFDLSTMRDNLFPCLIKLYLKDCPNLHELPYLPYKLEEFEIDNVGWKTLNWLQNTIGWRISIQNCYNFIQGRKFLVAREVN